MFEYITVKFRDYIKSYSFEIYLIQVEYSILKCLVEDKILNSILKYFQNFIFKFSDYH